MRAILSVLGSFWFLTLLGALILCLLVWFIGPLVAIADVRPLAPVWARVLAVGAILVTWGLWNLFRVLRQRRREKALEAGTAAAPGETAEDRAARDELRLLSDRLDEAVEVLRRSGGGRRSRGQYLYELPWYMLIGPPGSGKTTALVNSGLRFPLGDDRSAAVRGVGGTRNCDWWFADEAILLDTAGRYTTQDSSAQADHAAWTGFLGLLRGARPRQPINGVFVAVSVADMLSLGEAERRRHAGAIRARLSELQSELGVRFPVYVLFTKADLLAGFVEFFDDLGREERAQVWGATFPFDDGRGAEGAVAAFGAEFDALLERLNDRALERIQQEIDQDRRAAIFGFPTQVAALKPVLATFLDEVFRPSPLEPRFLLRGVYFTSGTQEGRPIDRVMAAMSRALGLSGEQKAHGRGGRAYFIRDLLREVAFAEAGLVDTNPRAERRERIVRYGALAATGLIVVLTGIAWAVSYTGNAGLIETARADVSAYEDATAELTAADVNAPRPERVVPALDILRALPGGYADEGWPPIRLTFGLYQGDRLGAHGVAAYRRALEELFLPTLVARVEEQVAGNLNRTGYLFEALKTYLMLGGQGPLDGDHVRDWLTLEWEARFPGTGNAELRFALGDHLDALLAEATLDYPLDARLIRDARERLREQPLAERAYDIIRNSRRAEELPDWTLTDQVGRAAAAVFVRGSGRPLDAPIDGLYTKRGFYDVFLPAMAGVIEQVNSEAWVLGGETEDVGVAGREKLRRTLLARYYRDYDRAWRDLLQDLQYRRPATLPEVADLVNDLASPTSPAAELLRIAAAETKLTQPPQSSAAGAADTAATIAGEATTSPSSRLARVLGDQLAEMAVRPGRPVEEAFRELHRFVDGAGMSGYLEELTRLYRRLETAAAQGETLDPSMIRVDSTLPAPLDTWTRGLSGGVRNIAVGTAREQFARAWNGEVQRACRDVVAGRYPFARDSRRDVPMADFARLFAPGGLIESFWRENMAGMVDTGSEPWRWAEGRAAELGLPGTMPEQFRRARAIRNAFFGLGGTAPRVTFTLEALALDPGAERVTIMIDGAEFTYAHGPPRPEEMTWPGSGAVRQARISFRPPPEGRPGGITINGPWAWFRLVDRAETASGAGPDAMELTFRIGARSVRLALRAQSVENPFALPELRSFRCPGRL